MIEIGDEMTRRRNECEKYRDYVESYKTALKRELGKRFPDNFVLIKTTYEIVNIEIPSNSVTLQSGISNRHSRTKGDTINGNVYNEDISLSSVERVIE